MTRGTTTYEGLAMGLVGEFTMTQTTAATDFLTLQGVSGMTGDFMVLLDSSSSELMWINNVGTYYVRNEVTATAYTGIDTRSEIMDGATGTWYSGMGHRITNSAQIGAQVYAGNLHWIGSATGNHTGGRGAVLNLICDIETGYGGSAGNTMAFINMDDQNDLVPSLFSFPATTAGDGGCFTARGSITGTHGLSINVGNTQYYIVVAATS